MSLPDSELFPCRGIGIHVACPVVFPGFLPHICRQDSQEVSSSQTQSLLISKESIDFLFAVQAEARPLPPPCNTFPNFHSEVKPFLKDVGWFNSAVPSVIQCLSAAASSALKTVKVSEATYRIQAPCVVPILTGLTFLFSL